MRTMKILALSTLVVGFMATSAVAGDCGSKNAETAKAKTEAQVAKSGSCGTSTAAAKTAKAGACDSSAKAASATKVAGAGCSSSASSAKMAKSGECSSDASNAKMAVKLETVRMPSGAMAVFYHGKNAETVAYLQASAKGGCQAFACDLAKNLAADENCTVEMAKTDTGVMMLVTAEKAEVVDQYEAQYAAVIASVDEQQGE